MSIDRRQFVKLTGVGASGVLATNTAAGEQSTVEPTAESFDFVGVSEEVRLVVNSDDPTNPARGITLSGVEPPLAVEGTAPGDGTWASTPTTVTETELIEGLRNFNDENDLDLQELLSDILDDSPEELVATLLEDLSVESLLANSNGAELFRIIADIIDALDLDAGQGEDIINAIDDGTGLLPDEVLGIDVPSIVEILEQDPALDNFLITINGFGLGDGAADKLLAGDVPRQERANLLQELLEQVGPVIDSLPSSLIDLLGFSIPDISTLNDATDLVELVSWLLDTLTKIQNTDLGGSSASVQELEAQVGDDPDQTEVLQALAELESQQTVSADDDTQQDDTVGTSQDSDPGIIDRLLGTSSVTELDNEIDTIAQEIRDQGFDAVFGGGDGGGDQNQDDLNVVLDLLEAQLSLDVNIEQISGDYTHDSGLMTAPVGENNVSADGSFQDGIISFIQDLIDALDDSSDDGGNTDPGIIDQILDAVDPADLQGLVDELLDELQAQNLIDLPTLEIGLTTGTSGSFDGTFDIADGPAGGSVQFVENEFTIGYDKLITDIENIDVAAALGNVEITEFDLKQDVIDKIADSVWNDISTTLGEELKSFAQDGGGFQNNPVAFLENNISGVSNFPTFLNDTAASAAQNIVPEELLTDLATNTDVDGLVSVVTGVAPDAFTDSQGRHAVEAAFTIVGKPGELPGGLTPQDTDGDGRFETFRATGDVNILDTQELFNALENGSAQQTPRAFDFSRASPDDEVTILDVASHWKEYASE